MAIKQSKRARSEGKDIEAALLNHENESYGSVPQFHRCTCYDAPVIKHEVKQTQKGGQEEENLRMSSKTVFNVLIKIGILSISCVMLISGMIYTVSCPGISLKPVYLLVGGCLTVAKFFQIVVFSIISNRHSYCGRNMWSQLSNILLAMGLIMGALVLLDLTSESSADPSNASLCQHSTGFAVLSLVAIGSFAAFFVYSFASWFCE